MKLFSRNKRIEDISPQLSLPNLVQRTRIVVIDDVETEFPFKILREQFGFSIDYWKDVLSLEKLEQGFYDIIILDIGGIGLDLDKENEGVGVLKHIKHVNSQQIVVAFSGQSHKTEQIPFFKLADQYVPKPANAITWKETLDDLMQSRISAAYYWNGLKKMLIDSGCRNRTIRKLEQEIIRSTKSNNTDFLMLTRNSLGTVDNLTTITSIITKIAALCTI